ncbi:MAG: acetyl-CoA carboxylase biotin carboxylase subunit [Thermoplasmata archaeon]|nr:acetyl-CoA carboxylase biotin carboxylase subunit [Thermoplasmata archaeon]
MEITKVLVANRGEIAVRIMTACQEMGIATVGVYSDVDAKSPHVEMADESYPLGDPTPSASYLNMDKLIDIAKKTGANAVHPGYGFLSENSKFAQTCADAGLKFIGPSAEVIDSMGDKIAAKRTMRKAGVPVIPGFTGEEKGETIQQACERIGFPVLIKASGGGGGKGMKIVHAMGELDAAIQSARREAKSSFGNDELLLEKYLAKPRHIEFQILADEFGNVVHLFERECSIQRRHQKVIEETPSVALDQNLRDKMGQAAILAAKTIGYSNAGTVEFMLDADKKFYFLEMNTRLQVEHAITEMTTGIDIVKWQIKIASGEHLTLEQEKLIQHGHAIECRIYAEDPEKNFMPSTGTLKTVELPTGMNIRHDTGISQGSKISPYYDPMLAKLIVYGEDRKDASRKMEWALSNYIALGVTTNIPFLRAIVHHPAFASGDLDTHFIETYFKSWAASTTLPPEVLIAAAIDDFKHSAIVDDSENSQAENESHSPWKQVGRWRIDS